MRTILLCLMFVLLALPAQANNLDIRLEFAEDTTHRLDFTFKDHYEFGIWYLPQYGTDQFYLGYRQDWAALRWYEEGIGICAAYDLELAKYTISVGVEDLTLPWETCYVEFRKRSPKGSPYLKAAIGLESGESIIYGGVLLSF